MENPKAIYLGFFCVLTLLGLGVLLWWRPSKKKKITELQQWQKTKAEILKLLNDNSDVPMELHPIKILYQYNIEGKTYKNSRIAFGYITDINYKQDIRLYNILRVKNTINIYYNPRNPKESVICRSGGERDIFVGMAWAIMSLLWALCLLIILILSHFYYRPDISPIINFMLITNIPIIVVYCREQVIYRSKIDPFTEDIRRC